MIRYKIKYYKILSPAMLINTEIEKIASIELIHETLEYSNLNNYSLI